MCVLSAFPEWDSERPPLTVAICNIRKLWRAVLLNGVQIGQALGMKPLPNSVEELADFLCSQEGGGLPHSTVSEGFSACRFLPADFCLQISACRFLPFSCRRWLGVTAGVSRLLPVVLRHIDRACFLWLHPTLTCSYLAMLLAITRRLQVVRADGVLGLVLLLYSRVHDIHLGSFGS